MTAKNDVDIYNNPVEPRGVIGMMQGGSTGRYLQFHADGWCKLRFTGTPSEGWVAQDHLLNCPP